MNFKESKKASPNLCDEDTYEIFQDIIRCNLCPYHCEIAPGRHGRCLSRQNSNKKLVIQNYGKLVTSCIDTIKNRPIYDWNKSKNIKSLTLGLAGCNNHCPFCLNYQISQSLNFTSKTLSPNEIVSKAIENNVGFISFTFTEPLVWYEFMRDVSLLAKKRGIFICLKTAGYINTQYVDRILDVVDVVNLDIKPLNKEYLKSCGVLDNSVVLNFAKECVKRGRHIEISHIVIEGVNADREHAVKFSNIIKMINKNICVHLLRHYPAWISKYPTTSDSALEYFKNNCIENKIKNIYTSEVG